MFIPHYFLGNEASVKAAKTLANLHQGSDNPHIAAQAKATIQYLDNGFKVPKVDFLKAAIKGAGFKPTNEMTLTDVQNHYGHGAMMKVRMFAWKHWPSLFPPQI